MNKAIRYLAAIVVASLSLSIPLLKAQDATPEATASGTIVCDSDLLLSLYTAEHFFGFSQILSTIPNPDPTLIANVSTLDLGQYTPWVNMLPNTLPIVSMSQQQMQDAANMMTMDDTTMQSQIAASLPAGTD